MRASSSRQATRTSSSAPLLDVRGVLLTFVGLILRAVSSWRAGLLRRAPMVLLVLAFLPLMPPVVAVLAVVALGWLAVDLRR